VAQEVVHPYEALTPDVIMDAVEQWGYVCDGRLLALNSYENRVYQVGIEDGQPLVAKFYRPERWSDAQILEEHAFCFELAGQELPVVAPLKAADGSSLSEKTVNDIRFRFALYPRKGGHAPELDRLENLYILGRLLGRMHRIGAVKAFEHRPRIDAQSFGHDSVALIQENFIPRELQASYRAITQDLLRHIDAVMAQCGDVSYIRVHGDCHVGNILWRDDNPNFVDFDDSRMAPAVQDIWMLLSGDRAEQGAQLAEIVEAYDEFYEFQPRELRLAETLRTLRQLHYSAWLARRWEDPAFPRNFPFFNTQRYWEDHILTLREQRALLDEPPLSLNI
jgi:Ser/Thr protein kinase RdoA (MazF antagonist)